MPLSLESEKLKSEVGDKWCPGLKSTPVTLASEIGLRDAEMSLELSKCSALCLWINELRACNDRLWTT